ncbi:MAG: mechanosensitive ion channel [Bacteroidaceae bacterium]|nr:mechanosensitive ion channel [Bacteroidaceae bacterium]MBQ4038754.1 mechanosensitive ion channel [Bacteroidaceae bacterium]
MSSISALTVEEIVKYLTSAGLTIGATIIKVALIWIIGRWLSKRLVTLVKKLMVKKNTDASIQTFLVSLIDIVALIVLLIIIISVVGIDTSSFIALFASAGVAIGMALSGTLQNFAGGVMVLLFRPYKVGDYIEAQGQAGTVKEIQIFNTLLQTPDNRIIIVPNGPLSTGIINNYSRETTRRVDFSFPISYGDDFELAKKVLMEIIEKDARIMKTPEPFIEVGAMATSSINITVRVWCNAADYWGIFFDMNKSVYSTFPAKGLHFPYNTITVNMPK